VLVGSTTRYEEQIVSLEITIYTRAALAKAMGMGPSPSKGPCQYVRNVSMENFSPDPKTLN
jgi:hypothetical protein